MTFESSPGFSTPAAERWNAIGADVRKRLLTNVWCSACRHEVTISNFTGVVRGGVLLLVGRCAECRGDVSRVIEAG
ncbi:MAG: hypothetical protein D4R79_16675 [Comamonadaceae bacterium]|nr:MAG: hypothetical protein D4R79_16675 [Comamonadaceae bacterium]